MFTMFILDSSLVLGAYKSPPQVWITRNRCSPSLKTQPFMPARNWDRPPAASNWTTPHLPPLRESFRYVFMCRNINNIGRNILFSQLTCTPSCLRCSRPHCSSAYAWRTEPGPPPPVLKINSVVGDTVKRCRSSPEASPVRYAIFQKNEYFFE